MRPILCGLETEYGLEIEGATPKDQSDHSRAVVESHQGPCFVGWDYRHESPRSDLRGFQLERLAYDARDAAYDRGRALLPAEVERADRVLANGARFYNDHGHPEYATPECLSSRELALHDAAGERIVARAARAYAERLGRKVRVYKNNSDGHGASYGTHESYLVPRELGFARLYRAVTPMLVVRSLLCGAGKARSEQGTPCRFQSSQRAEFLTQPANAETLANRPVFNTRDEPHASAAEWIRLHVIAGDATMSARCTRRKVDLVKTAIALEELGLAPEWDLLNPGAAVEATSKELGDARLALSGDAWASPLEIMKSYLEAALQAFGDEDPYEAEIASNAEECSRLIELLPERGREFCLEVEWAAKLGMIEGFFETEGSDYESETAASLDLAFHLLSEDEGLYPALVAEGIVAPVPNTGEVEARELAVFEPTRALARSVAVTHFPEAIAETSWGSLTLHTSEGLRKLALDPDGNYPDSLRNVQSADELAQALVSRK